MRCVARYSERMTQRGKRRVSSFKARLSWSAGRWPRKRQATSGASRVRPSVAENQSPLPCPVFFLSLLLLVDQQPGMACQRNSFREVVKGYRFHDEAVDSKSIAFDNVLFFAG